jgi:XRE family transcriptional regulator, regulator of sulfur utilization
MTDQDSHPPQDLRDTHGHVMLGKNMRAVRDAMRISREVLAERAGINADYLGEIERGEKWPALWMIRSIARVLKVSPARFFEFEDDESDDASVIDKFQRTLDNRTLEEQQQALRIVRALFGL